MQLIDNVELWLAGEGDLSAALRQQAAQLGVQAWAGLNLLENRGLSYYYSLATKFFDYVQAGRPVLTMNFPEYRALNAQYEVALLLDELSPARVAAAIMQLRGEEGLYARLQLACAQAREIWNWEVE